MHESTERARAIVTFPSARLGEQGGLVCYAPFLGGGAQHEASERSWAGISRFAVPLGG